MEVDNSTAIAFADDSGKRSKMRHIDCRQRWVQALRDHSLVTLQKVDTNDNLADLFTKILGPLRRALIYFQARNSTEGQWAVCWPQTRAFRVRLSAL